METVPIHLREANEFIVQHHRHNLPTDGGKFAIGAAQDGKLVGWSLPRPLTSQEVYGKPKLKWEL